ncbi:hypothetical protein CR513_43582, partial [Mucuna pruriens]
MATWKDLDLSFSEEEDKEANIYMMADITSEEKDDEEEENDSLKKDNESLKEEKTNDLSKVNVSKVNENFQEKVIDLKQSLAEFANVSENLKNILKHKRHLYDKTSIGYDKKKDLKKDKSNSHCLNYGGFGYLSYDCRNCPKGSSKPTRTNKKVPKRI